LSFRDFKKAKAVQQQVNVKVVLADESKFEEIEEANIVYINLETFLKYSNKHWNQLPSIYCIVDESDIVFFDKTKTS
jgi:hypothetical protein